LLGHLTYCAVADRLRLETDEITSLVRDRQPLELAVNHFNPARYTYRFHLRATRS
jgi:hypothetical protein